MLDVGNKLYNALFLSEAQNEKDSIPLDLVTQIINTVKGSIADDVDVDGFIISVASGNTHLRFILVPKEEDNSYKEGEVNHLSCPEERLILQKLSETLLMYYLKSNAHVHGVVAVIREGGQIDAMPVCMNIPSEVLWGVDNFIPPTGFTQE